MKTRTAITFLAILFFSCLTRASFGAEQSLHAVKGNPPAPDFTLKDIDNNSHSLKQYKGRVVIINFWATWCPPCRFELPAMERAYQILKKENVEFLAIDVGESADTIFTFTVDYPVTFPLLMDMDSSVISKYNVIGMPTTFVIDTKGNLAYRAIGTRDWDNIEVLEKIRKLIPAR